MTDTLDDVYKTIAFELELEGDNLRNSYTSRAHKNCNLSVLSPFLNEEFRPYALLCLLEKRMDTLENILNNDLEYIDVAQILNTANQYYLQYSSMAKILDSLSGSKFHETANRVSYNLLCYIHNHFTDASTARKTLLVDILRTRCHSHLVQLLNEKKLTRKYIKNLLSIVPSTLKHHLRKTCDEVIPRDVLMKSSDDV